MQAMMNPDMMGNMLKGSMFMMIQQFVMFSVIGYFFSGFINAKMPFPLAQSFRSMLQQGLTLENLDVRYVSSLSMCFILMFGLQSATQLLLGEQAMDDMKMQMTMGMNDMQGGGGMPNQQKDFNLIFKNEKQNFELLTHKFALNDIEE